MLYVDGPDSEKAREVTLSGGRGAGGGKNYSAKHASMKIIEVLLSYLSIGLLKCTSLWISTVMCLN